MFSCQKYFSKKAFQNDKKAASNLKRTSFSASQQGAVTVEASLILPLFLIVLLLYPLEVVRPGWLNLKRITLLLFPYVSITLFYYIILYLLGQKPLELQDVNQFMAHIGEFNVGYRLLMILSKRRRLYLPQHGRLRPPLPVHKPEEHSQ